MLFDGFFGIDWSGDKSKFQKGIKVAYLDKKNLNPKIVKYIIIGYKKYKCLHPPNLEVFNSETIKKVKTKQKKRYKS